jgi:hypothetical protein
MGMSLLGRQRDMRVNGPGWFLLLNSAVEHGWRPAGTVLDDFMVAQEMGLSHDPEAWDELAALRIRQVVDSWDGSYTSNNGQWVEDHDAHALAAALSLMLERDPDLYARAGAFYALVSELVELCRDGGFRIW